MYTHTHTRYGLVWLVGLDTNKYNITLLGVKYRVAVYCFFFVVVIMINLVGNYHFTQFKVKGA